MSWTAVCSLCYSISKAVPLQATTTERATVPYYPADVDDNALRFFGPERYHSDEFQDEAYLFISFDEDYYEAMAQVIEERFAKLAGTGLRRGHAGAFRGGSGHHGVSGLRVYLFPIHGR